MSSLAPFDPLVAAWFRERLGTPTAVQAEAWARVARGEHVLVAAETGSGKTLAAFLHVINALLTGGVPTGGLRALYISPLKALGADVRENLAGPLTELRRRFQAAGRVVPEVRVMTRSGDTPQPQRRSMLRRPPEILVTTPESLHLLLTSLGGRALLGGVRLVILDEIHAVAGNRRGTLLSLGVERLAQLCGDFQRVALSATVRPEEVLARFVGGYRLTGEAGHLVHTPRPVAVVRGTSVKPLAVTVRVPERTGERTPGDFYEPYAAAWREMLSANRTTAFFIDSRRLCEKMARLINAEADPPLVYPHHGSLSREVRRAVEKRLKAGTLRGVVATGSLELGIDVGDLDAVALIQTPPSISAAVQRVGRSGHRVGATRQGVFFPLSDVETALAGVMARAVAAGDIEDVSVPRHPLDVLAQTLVSMTAHEAVPVDLLFEQVRCAAAYHDLPRRLFDLVLAMLAGRYGEVRPRELAARVFHDRVAGTVRARSGATLSLYASGGVIPDRGTFTARVAGEGASRGVVAELDEEFVFEARLGQVFAAGGQGWRIERITPAEVIVSPAPAASAAPPFWHGDQRGWDAHFASRIGAFFQWAEDRLGRGTGADDPDFLADLARDYHLEPHAARVLATALAAQRTATGAPLPHSAHIVVEHTATGPGGVPGRQTILHMPFGLRVNRTMALVLEAAFADRLGQEVRSHAANEGVALICPDDSGDMAAAKLFALVSPADVEGLLRRRLEGSQEFGAAFREAAWRSLVLGRSQIGRRMPLWITRLASQKLFAAVRDLADFPLVIEAWRTCLTERFDVPGLVRVLAGLQCGGVAWTETRTVRQSPLARDMVWRVVAGFMYAGDQSGSPAGTGVSPDLVAEAAADAGLRPLATAEAAARLGELVRRTAPGHSPGSSHELLQHVVERLAIPLSEWQALLLAMSRDHGLSPGDLERQLSDRLTRIPPPGSDPGAGVLVVAVENLPRLRAARILDGPSVFGDPDGVASVSADVAATPVLPVSPDSPETDKTPEAPQPPQPPQLDETPEAPELDDAPNADEAAIEALAEWLRFYGPVDGAFPIRTLGLDPGRGRTMLAALVRHGACVAGRLVSGGGSGDVCDTANFERLLRLGRTLAAPLVRAVPLARLTPFLAVIQGLAPRGESAEALFERLRRLTCLSLPASLWEAEVLPARMAGYAPAILDEVLRHGGLSWLGSGPKRLSFVFPGDIDLLAPDTGRDVTADAPAEAPGDAPGDVSDGLAGLFPDSLAAYDFSALMRRSGLRPGELANRLWAAVWRGEVQNEAFEVLRHGLRHDFRLPDLSGGAAGRPLAGLPPGRTALPRAIRERVGRGRLACWRAALPQTGVWRRVIPPPAAQDRLEIEEQTRERARLLLDRYGVVFRDMLVREAGPFQYGAVFRALRLLELSGEAVSGRFFDGAPGLQFLSHRGLAVFRRLFGTDADGQKRAATGRETFWLCALDPAAPVMAGLVLPGDGAPHRTPRRGEGTHLVFCGGELALVSEGRGRELFVGPGPDDPALPELFTPLVHLLSRRESPLRRVAVARINGQPAAASPYRPALSHVFQVTADHKGLSLTRRQS